jgi:hypothetical protein
VPYGTTQYCTLPCPNKKGLYTNSSSSTFNTSVASLRERKRRKGKGREGKKSKENGIDWKRKEEKSFRGKDDVEVR